MITKGIVLAGGSGTRLYPLTIATSKQLMPVYDKPMIYYPISALMLSGIREVLIITTPIDSSAFRRLLGDGSQFGINISYAEQLTPDGLAQAFHIADDVKFLNNESVALILGDNLLYGNNLPSMLRKICSENIGATIFGYHVADPKSYGVVEIGADGQVVSLEEKPLRPRSNYAIPGIYFYNKDVVQFARSLKPSIRGEFEITDLNRIYLERGILNVEIICRGTAWFDTGTHESLAEASQFVSVIENRQGLKISCLEEIGYRNGWISRSSLEASIVRLGKSSYGQYLKTLKEPTYLI